MQSLNFEKNDMLPSIVCEQNEVEFSFDFRLESSLIIRCAHRQKYNVNCHYLN